MQAEGLSHIMHNLLGREKKPLYTSKEIKSRVKSNSGGIVKMGGPPHHALHLTRFVSVTR